MNIDDFIKLPAGEAGLIYRQHRDAGDAQEASRLHQSYYEAHRLRLSDDRQIAEAAPAPRVVKPGSARPMEVASKPQRSIIRRVGTMLSGAGLLIGLFSIAASIGLPSLVLAGCMASSGFALWLVGILEDRLLSIQGALEAR